MEFADRDYPGSPTDKGFAMKKWIAFTIVPAIIIASQAWAGNYDGHFGDMDTSGDDQVTWEEFHAHFPDADQADYTAMVTMNGMPTKSPWVSGTDTGRSN